MAIGEKSASKSEEVGNMDIKKYYSMYGIAVMYLDLYRIGLPVVKMELKVISAEIPKKHGPSRCITVPLELHRNDELPF